MRATRLNAFAQSDYLREIGDDRVIEIVRPPIGQLIDALAGLSDDASSADKIACFRSCILALNEAGHDIDTITREVLCDRLYELADLVGLDSGTGFLDEWRDF